MLYLLTTMMTLFFGLGQAWSATPTPSIASEIRTQHLDVYERIGTVVTGYLREDFAKKFSSKQKDPARAFELWDEGYSQLFRSGEVQGLNSSMRSNSIQILVEDTNRALALKNKYAKEYRVNAQLRYRVHKIFIGLLHVIDTAARSQIGSSLDELLSLKRFLLSQGAFVASDKNTSVNKNDIWWDYIWARGLNFPIDIVDLNIKKINLIAKREKSLIWGERLRLFANSMIVLTLHRNTPPVFKVEKVQSLYLKLAEQAYQYFSTRNEQASKDLKIYLYRFMLKSGYSFEANSLKNDIAMDVLKSKAQDITKSSSLGLFFQSILSFLTFVIGFIFVATPIELVIVIIALAILSRQGQVFFGAGHRKMISVLQSYRIFTRHGWRQIPAALREIGKIIVWNLSLAWRMFMTTYTGTSVPFYSKLASSLLIFGIGLYFNSARTAVESIVNQLTMP